MSEYFDRAKTARQIASELAIAEKQVRATMKLLEDGNTLPFIARYRKEATNGLDEVAIRKIDDGVTVAQELAARKATILKSIDEQGKLTEGLKCDVLQCQDKRSLEAIYLPFKQKRKTRASVARERGLQPLADILLAQKRVGQPRGTVLKRYVDAKNHLNNTDEVLAGACDIVAETWAMQPEQRQWMQDQALEFGRIQSKVKRGKKESGAKFEAYFDHSDRVDRIPSHRFLAMKRGESDGILKVSLSLDSEIVLRKLKRQLVTNREFEFFHDLLKVVEDCYSRLLLPTTESAILQQCKEKADIEAIRVFSENLRNLLLAPPAGAKVTMGVDPGFRTGCKIAVVDGTGKYLENATVYPTPPKNDRGGAGKTLLRMIEKHDVQLIAIGNGTASRETDQFVAELIKENSLSVQAVMVNESGASIYSASELAGREFPDLDLTVRGAISIAHRLQDPLAELVKIDPKSIGVGQYQHDVNQTLLRRTLDREVESCVNLVGVDVNMASGSLLSHVAGIGPKLAERIVEYRDANGEFGSRSDLKAVPKLGKKAFEQSAGFLRISNGNNPLDASGVHPESYHVVQAMAKRLEQKPGQLVGNETLVSKLSPRDFVSDRAGLMTVKDILDELAKPGRDPRKKFQAVKFKEGVNEITDLKPGMVLEGKVTNVTRFGAFVDLGVHQDALIHISELADQYVADPSEVVSVGDVVKVKILNVELDRKRIAASRKQV